MESILTTLIFDHALRLRVKAETSKTAQIQPSATPGNGQSKPGKDDARGGKSGNVVGKIMTMATSDLNNITGGRNFLLLGTSQVCEAIS